MKNPEVVKTKNILGIKPKLELYKIYSINYQTSVNAKRKNEFSFIDLAPVVFIIEMNENIIKAINLNRLFSFQPDINTMFNELKQRFLNAYKSNAINKQFIKTVISGLTYLQRLESLRLEDKQNRILPDLGSRIRDYSIDKILSSKPIERFELEQFIKVWNETPIKALINIPQDDTISRI
jgi:hypothetical protein